LLPLDRCHVSERLVIVDKKAGEIFDKDEEAYPCRKKQGQGESNNAASSRLVTLQSPFKCRMSFVRILQRGKVTQKGFFAIFFVLR